MLSELWDDSAGKCTLRKLTTSCPVISIHQDDVVYLSSKVGLYDGKAWVVGVDLRVKTVEILEPYSAEGTSLYQISFPACTFSEQLNTNPRHVFFFWFVRLVQNDTSLSYLLCTNRHIFVKLSM